MSADPVLHVTPTSDAAITDATHVLREKIDVLLDRLTDVVLGSPTPGTAQWRNLVQGPGDLTRIARGRHRADIRALIAEHAGVTDPVAGPRSSSMSLGNTSGRRRHRRTDPAQMFIF